VVVVSISSTIASGVSKFTRYEREGGEKYRVQKGNNKKRMMTREVSILWKSTNVMNPGKGERNLV